MAVRIARHLGVEEVFAVDSVRERLALAVRHGGTPIDMNDIDDVAEALLQLTDGRGPDSVIDAVGMEAHGGVGSVIGKAAQAAVGVLPDAVARPVIDKLAIDRMAALHTAMKACRRGGTVSISGVYGGEIEPMPMMEMFDRGLQIRMGQAHVKRWIDDILPLVVDDDVLGVEDLATHRLPLAEAPHGYDIFQRKEDDCIKVILQP